VARTGQFLERSHEGTEGTKAPETTVFLRVFVASLASTNEQDKPLGKSLRSQNFLCGVHQHVGHHSAVVLDELVVLVVTGTPGSA
jgi:hypothetical protein